MRLTRYLPVLLGGALFAALLVHADAGAVLREVGAVGAAGLALVLAIYAIEFLCDVLAWQLTLPGVAGTARWTARLFAVRMAGEAWNALTPLGGMGGEPVKAIILKRRYDLPFTGTGASLVLAKTANLLSLLVFLAIGFALMAGDARIPPQARALSALGLGALSLAVGGFLLAQRLRLTSRLAGALGQRRTRVQRVLASLREFDHRLYAFYTTDPPRFALVLALGLLNWVLGALGVWVTLWFMGRPVSFPDAWIIEAVAQMVRAGTFFVPASLGAQDGAIMLLTGAITGDAGAGLAVALVRRARELLWILAGLAAGTRLLRGAAAARGADSADAPPGERGD